MLSGVSRKTLVALLLAGWIALAAGPVVAAHDSSATSGERCLSCPDCTSGGCDDEHGTPGSHEHCCQASCWSHTAWLMPAEARIGGPRLADGAPLTPACRDPQQRSSSVFHPPRA